MSDIIKLLPDSVANQIAAGEVIQRPASVIKELVENAVDAGATKIDIFVCDAGKTSIQVVDNGKGMSETDARLSFERHATSKIRNAADLFNLTTMGFRGEALASIAAVSQVELKTRTADDDLGTCLCIAGSRVESQEPVSCPVGSNFTIKNLFYNVPARRRFLKSNFTELSNIITAFERIVLVYPDISFTLSSNGALLHNLPSAPLRKRIIDVVGKKLDQHLLPISVNTILGKISGFIGRPESARKKGAEQYFFVNGRYMRHPYFHKAVLNAYERLLPAGDQPPYFIYFDVDAKDIDVNIHPVKTEIKFENEQSVFTILMAGVREALGTFCELPTLDLSGSEDISIPTYDATSKPSTLKTNYDPHYNPFNKQPASDVVPNNWQTLYATPERRKDATCIDNEALFADRKEQPQEQSIFDTPYSLNDDAPCLEDSSPQHYQYKGSLILTAVKSGLLMVNQHRAHIRILYEQLMALHSHAITGASQKVIFPDVVEISPKEMLWLEQSNDTLSALGFEIQNLGNGRISISAVPATLTDIEPNILLRDILSCADETDIDDPVSNLVLRIAHASAIPVGQVLSNEEMESIINSLFTCQNVNYTPDGKRIFTILPQTDIDGLLR